MKKVIILLVTLMATPLMAQEKSVVTIKSREVHNGVIILTVHQADAMRQGNGSFVLHRNQDLHDCAVLAAGNYLMVRLPQNLGHV